jgi:hypothetical protein
LSWALADEGNTEREVVGEVGLALAWARNTEVGVVTWNRDHWGDHGVVGQCRRNQNTVNSGCPGIVREGVARDMEKSMGVIRWLEEPEVRFEVFPGRVEALWGKLWVCRRGVMF